MRKESLSLVEKVYKVTAAAAVTTLRKLIGREESKKKERKVCTVDFRGEMSAVLLSHKDENNSF